MPTLSLGVEEVVLENSYATGIILQSTSRLKLKVKIVTESSQIIVLNPNGRLKDFPITINICASDGIQNESNQSTGSMELIYNDFNPNANYYNISIELKIPRQEFVDLISNIKAGFKLNTISLIIDDGFVSRGEFDAVWDVHVNSKVTVKEFRALTKIQGSVSKPLKAT